MLNYYDNMKWIKTSDCTEYSSMGCVRFSKKSEYEYGNDYFKEYVSREKSMIGHALNLARVNIAKRHIDKGNSIYDIGCGTGAFIKEMWTDNCYKVYGYDVNPQAVKWLNSKGLYKDITDAFDYDMITFFDSFEHIYNNCDLLDKVKINGKVIISIPIIDLDNMFESIHFKPSEHLYYYDDKGINNLFNNYGFKLIKKYDIEIALGRKDIYTYVFERIQNNCYLEGCK